MDPVSSGCEVGLTVYEIAIPILVAALGWVAKKVGDLIGAKVKNEMVSGMLARLNESVFESVIAVNQEMKDLIGKAKDPASPGGVKITKDEAAKLKDAALKHVKEYWGAKGLNELAAVLGFGGSSNAALDVMLKNKIEAAVGQVKSEARNPK